MNQNIDNQKPITIRDLYPHMSEEELVVAEANLKRYVAVVVKIYDRLKAEGKVRNGRNSDATFPDRRELY